MLFQTTCHPCIQWCIDSSNKTKEATGVTHVSRSLNATHGHPNNIAKPKQTLQYPSQTQLAPYTMRKTISSQDHCASTSKPPMIYSNQNKNVLIKWHTMVNTGYIATSQSNHVTHKVSLISHQTSQESQAEPPPRPMLHLWPNPLCKHSYPLQSQWPLVLFNMEIVLAKRFNGVHKCNC